MSEELKHAFIDYLDHSITVWKTIPEPIKGSSESACFQYRVVQDLIKESERLKKILTNHPATI